jgi:hypothetical protein
MAQQTAVSWYIEQHKILSSKTGDMPISELVVKIKNIEIQAKEMEKQQKKYFFDCGRQYQLTGEGTFTQVYNETYGK